MIKNYLELRQFEIEKLIEFINRNKESKMSFEEIDKQFKSMEYDFGRGIILKIHEKNIISSISVVLSESNKKGIAYAVKLDISEVVEDKELAAAEMIEEVKKIAKRYGAQKIFLGAGDKDILKILNSLGLNKKYSAIKMILEDRKIRSSTLKLVALSEENKKEYLSVYNDAFKEVPNGATLTEEEVDEYVKKEGNSNYYYMTEAEGKIVGFLQFNIEKGVGEFDLGLIETARGKGYGKQILETAIDFLNSKEVEEIRLMIITKNKIAYDLYKKRGFKESNTISDWFEIDF